MNVTAKGRPGSPPSPATFQPTRWTLVVRARGQDAPAATRLGCQAGHARVLVHRLRQAYRAAVLTAVADTLELATPEAIEEELAALVRVFG